MTSIFGKKIAKFIDDNHLLRHDDRVIVGLSGGADSVSLLKVLVDLGYDCLATHCNFHLRGDESMRDEQFCRDLCVVMNIQLMTVDFDVAARCASTSESVEMACRGLRYEWWEKLLRDGYGSCIAVGHHREDNIETLFLNMLRGSGIAGLKGMLPRTANIVRPLLEVTRGEIEDYLMHHNIKYVVDSTNMQNEYRRNRLRNQVLPVLEAAFPGAMDNIAESLSHLRDNYALYLDYSNELRMKYVKHDGSIDLTMILTTEPNARMVLYELLSKVGFNMTHVRNIINVVNGRDASQIAGRIFHGPEISYLLNRGHLIPLKREMCPEEDTCEKVDITASPFSIRHIGADEFMKMCRDGKLRKDVLYLDIAALDSDPDFELRSWRKGDRIEPFGMRGSKLVSDLLSDAKYSLNEKSQVRILTRNGVILWIIGLRTSRHFAVTSESRGVIEVGYCPIAKHNEL
ncbi:MAG: tRNA lysidine(34) synthetase TilS [Bacteroides sp.]|nr:tRNA lysidine(34) synthetase TilS [Bacteroides sp.]